MISVIVPSYNAEKYINNCISSILNQTYRDIEVICINDGSTDDTQFLLNRFAQNDNRIKVINVENGGISKARNIGLDAASGEALMFVDSDDELYSEHSIEILAAQLTNDVDAVISSATVIHDYNYTGKTLADDQKYFTITSSGIHHMDANLLTSTCVTAWGKLYRKSVIDQLQLRFPEGLRFEDEFWFRAYFADRKAMFLKESSYKYYRRDGSIMSQVIQNSDKHGIELLKILEALILFYKKNNLFEKMQQVLVILANRYFHTSKRYSQPWDHPLCLAVLTKILRQYDIDCDTNKLLNEIKNGSYLTNLSEQLAKERKITKSVSEQLAKEREITKIVSEQLTKEREVSKIVSEQLAKERKITQIVSEQLRQVQTKEQKISKIVSEQIPHLIKNGELDLNSLKVILRRYRRTLMPLYRLFHSKHKL